MQDSKMNSHSYDRNRGANSFDLIDQESAGASMNSKQQEVPFENHVVHQSMAFLDDTNAYFQAVAWAPQVVQLETPHDLFYEFAACDMQAAALRLANYWRLRRDLFAERYLLPLPLAMNPEEWNFLMRGGAMQLPPGRDSSVVLFVDRDLHNRCGADYAAATPLSLRQRCLFYHMHMMQLQSSRYCLLFSQDVATASAVTSDEFQQVLLARTLREECMCLQPIPETIHLISTTVNSGPQRQQMGTEGGWSTVLSTLSSCWSGGSPRPHVCWHSGRAESIRQSLMQGGLRPHQMPVSVGGEFAVDEWQGLLTRQLSAPFASLIPYYSSNDHSKPHDAANSLLPAQHPNIAPSGADNIMIPTSQNDYLLSGIFGNADDHSGSPLIFDAEDAQQASPSAMKQGFVAAGDEQVYSPLVFDEVGRLDPLQAKRSVDEATQAEECQKKQQQHTATLEGKRLKPAASFVGHPVHEAMEYVLCSSAYFQALERCAHVVSRETPHERYLTFFACNVWEAAQRLANYWKWRVEIFGEDRAFLGLREGGLQPEDYEFLRGGRNALMPPDSSGRSVLFIDRSIVHAPTKPEEMPSRARSFFFLFHAMMEEQWSLWDDGLNNDNVGEFVIFLKSHKSRMSPFRSDYKHVDLFKRLTKEAMCLTKCSHMHVVSGYDPRSASRRVLETLFGKVLNALSSFFRKMPNTLHTGTSEEISVSLQKCGFASSGLPESFGGSWSVNREWAKFISLGARSLAAQEKPLAQPEVGEQAQGRVDWDSADAGQSLVSPGSGLLVDGKRSERGVNLDLFPSMPPRASEVAPCQLFDWSATPDVPPTYPTLLDRPHRDGELAAAAHDCSQHGSLAWPLADVRQTSNFPSSLWSPTSADHSVTPTAEAPPAQLDEPPSMACSPFHLPQPSPDFLQDLPPVERLSPDRLDSMLSMWDTNDQPDLGTRVADILEARKAKRRGEWRSEKKKLRAKYRSRRLDAEAIRSVDTNC